MKFGCIYEDRDVGRLGLSASDYYPWSCQPESWRTGANRALTEDIRLLYAESRSTFDSPRIHTALCGNGRRMNRSRTASMMRRFGLRGLATLLRRTKTTGDRYDCRSVTD